MLMFIISMLFMMPLCLNKNFWWLVHSLMFMLSFAYVIYYHDYFDYNSISMYLSYDFISYMMILLSFWICSLMITSSMTIYLSGFYSSIFLFVVLFLMLMLYMAFSSMSLFSFYIYFESSLIPTLLLILGWGYQPERLQAGIYLIFYTLVASLPLLIVLFKIYDMLGSLLFPMLFDLGVYGMYIYVFSILAFLVKMPMYLIHLWLPKAHVEAPVSGSMILAGVMLKLGGYGLIRIMKVIMHYGFMYNYFIIGLSLMGGMIVSLNCMRQIDLKSLIAYSSVVHMSMVIAGLFSMNTWSYFGSLYLMLGHGLCSSGIFCLANVCYERLGSRSLLINKGMLNFMPSMCLWWFLLSSSNMAFPPSLNLLGEFSLLNGIISWSIMMMLVLLVLSFFSAAYTLYMYSYSQHGVYYSGLYSFSLGYLREYILMLLHWLPLNVIFMKSDLFIV